MFLRAGMRRNEDLYLLSTYARAERGFHSAGLLNSSREFSYELLRFFTGRNLKRQGPQPVGGALDVEFAG